MTTHEHHLVGCRPEPLGSYLKALGVLRLVAEQADRDASACWAPDGFVLSSRLDHDALVRFFLEAYQPSPILSPWNSSSGFGPEGAGELHVIEASADPRLQPYREAIEIARVDVVPRVVVNGGGGDDNKGMAGSNLMEGLLTLLLSDKLGVQVTGNQKRESNPEADRLREEIRKSLSEKREDASNQPGPAAPASGSMPGSSTPPPAPSGPMTPPPAAPGPARPYKPTK